MNTLVLKTGDEAAFFRRGRELAQLADQGRPLPCESVLSFEDPADLVNLFVLLGTRLAAAGRSGGAAG